MITKSIVVRLADDPRHRIRLELAIALARRFDAHVNVVYAEDPAENPPATIGRAASLAFIEDAEEKARDRMKAIREEAEALCRAGVRSWEWHDEQGMTDEIVARYTHLADLVIIDQAPQERLEDRVLPNFAHYLVASAGCPMLLVPSTWTGGDVGKRVLVAWKNSREAISAVRGSLNFLHAAEQVLVLADAKATHAEPPGSDLVAYLGYHGIAAEVCGVAKRGGRDILETAAERGADLIVMGAFAKSRLRELITGGNTDHVIRHTTVPVLMRH